LGVRLRPGEVWVSGDYTGATDNLKSEVSEIIVSEICRVAQLSDSTSRLFKVALTGHGLELPNGDVIAQTNGQLMGSPVSFPVLCIANLALTVVALRRVEGQTSRPIGHSGIAINGDDIGFGAGPDGIASWKEVTTEGGLSQSVGKNFESSDFIQLNSQMFRIESRQIDARYALKAQQVSRWVRVPQASLQVLAPPRDVTFGEYALSAPQWQSTFLNVFTGEERDRLNSLFLECWSPFNNRLPSELMNWFIPRALGGFGLLPTRTVHCTERQLHIAAHFRDNTDPTSARLQRLRWEPVEAATSAFADTQKFTDLLVKGGLLEWRWLDADEEEVDTSVVTQSLVLSGWSHSTKKGTMGRISESVSLENALTNEPFHDVPPHFGLYPQVSVSGLGPLEAPLSRSMAANTRVENLLRRAGWSAAEENMSENKREGVEQSENLSWLYATTRILRRAAKSTARRMTPEDVAQFTHRRSGFAPVKGWRVLEVTPISVALHSDKLLSRGILRTPDLGYEAEGPWRVLLESRRLGPFEYMVSRGSSSVPLLFTTVHPRRGGREQKRDPGGSPRDHVLKRPQAPALQEHAPGTLRLISQIRCS